jgi:protein involved in polysaccharide export with SLBB domain
VLQAVSLASGITKTAKANQVKVLRLTPGSATRTELVLNLQLMLNGKVNDVMLQPDDILFVPNNLRKELGIKTLDALAGTAATGVIYRLP